MKLILSKIEFELLHWRDAGFSVDLEPDWFGDHDGAFICIGILSLLVPVPRPGRS